MTFEEAVEFKKSLGKKTIKRDGYALRILITPSSPADIIRYEEDFRKPRNFTDEVAKIYSRDKQFTVQGLCIDGAIVIRRSLH